MTRQAAGHAALMDGNYRFQRHVYDATRKHYLLGRDKLVAALDVPPGGSVLEIGCGTGRNLLEVGRLYPHARLYGLDISRAMLETAASAFGNRLPPERWHLAQGDAAQLDAGSLFAVERFDRVFASYTLSMIPDWEQAIDAALAALKPQGTLHVVDFGQQAALPHWFRSGLRAWLRRFHVEPRAGLHTVLADRARVAGRELRFNSLYRDYAWLARIGPAGFPQSAPDRRASAATMGCGR
jgi:S-adenosylmethionine-diacylgycerolhomoserine-N-methlytransferase